MTDADFSQGCAFVDGEFVPKSEARISIFDLGFLLSDVTYDAVHVWQGSFFRLDDHLDRFDQSLASLRMKNPYDRAQMREIVATCVRRAGLRNALVEVICTRGVPADGRRDLRKCENRLIAFAVPFIWIVNADELEAGAHLIVSSVPRIPPESVDPRIKNFNRLDFSRALFEAYDKGAHYAVLPDYDGYVTEGLGYNIFAYANGVVLSPDAGVLEGVTRRTVMELCAETNVEARLAKITPEALRGADEVFMATTAGGIMPVTKVDESVIGDGAPGPFTQRLSDLYWAWHERPEFLTPVDYDAADAA